MKDFILRNRPGQFLVIGTSFLILGYLLMMLSSPLARWSFYISIFFLGFFAGKHAVVETIQDRSPNVDLLMILAALGAVIINFESEGAMLLLIFAGAEVLEEYANDKSTSAISELMAQVPETAQVLRPTGEVVEVLTADLQIGDVVIVVKGAQIPIDGYTDREAIVNESVLTGEAMPVKKSENDEVFAGTLNEGNVIHIEVNKPSDETVFSNIIRMVEEAQGRPSRVAKFIDRIESKYVITVLVMVPLFIFIAYYFFQFPFAVAFYRGMVFLTVASPCALVAAATPATLSAISNGAKNGVLFKGGAAIEALGTMDVLYTDKTGTLTEGEFQVVDFEIDPPILKEVIYMEQQSSHPIASAIVAHFQGLDLSAIDKTEPILEIAGSGVQKGKIKVGKPSSFDEYQDPHAYRPYVSQGETTVFVGVDEEIVGYFILADQIRPQAKEAIAGFQSEGIEVLLLTGDHEGVAQKVAHEVGIETYVASMLPEDKTNYVMASQESDEVVGMIGDGINDAPALANADIGIAMGSGSSVAMESADVVIVKNDLTKLFYSYGLSHRLNKLILQNVVFALAVIVILILLNLFGVLALPLAVLFHEGSTILVILNGLRLLRYND